jgi:tRNA (guanine-N7-)-methyltransferase
MPHILVKKHNDIKLYKNINGVDFNFIAKNKFEDKICVSVDNKKFFLTKLTKDNNHLIKIDQTTRITPISLAKQALESYANICKSEILFSNISNSKNKLEPKKEYLKDISYFVYKFKTNKNIFIEVGFGSGKHLLYQAKKNPNNIYIGLEIHTPSIEQILIQIKLLNITNIYVLNYDARLFLEFLQSNSVSQIFVHFPVPWDKKPHRRIISNEFIQECLRALDIDGTLELRTDSPNYYEYSKSLFNSFFQYKSTIYKNKSIEISSKYEDRWKKLGKNIWDLTIYSNENSLNINISKNFDFDIKNDININKLEQNLIMYPIIKNDYFVHFNKIYLSNSSLALASLTMGSFDKPVNIYIMFDKDHISYFKNNPIPISANHKAHKLINKLLNEVNQ